MKSPIIKRSAVINGHKTSVSTEDAFWAELKLIARRENISLSDLMTNIDRERKGSNLSSALRVFVLRYHRSAGGDFDRDLEMRGGSSNR
jgi:predicted DNA-binding ribbon-helix-helix protein